MDDNNKRRRGLGVVTPNACTECRKKRAKCDGAKPSCARCSSQKNVHCVYELPVRQSKEHMRSEIEQLRVQNQHSEKILAALVSNENSSEVLEQLRNGETIETVLETLELNEPAGKGKRASISMAKTQEGAVVTTYPRGVPDTLILGAINPSRSIGSSPHSTIAWSDKIHNSPGIGSWPQWEDGDEAGASAQTTNISNVGDDDMNWVRDPGRGATQYPLIGTWHHHSEEDSFPDTITQNMRAQGRETMLGQAFGPGDEENFAGSWSEITNDQPLVEHLMALYFCWEYPTFASLSKEHFLEDFAHGRRRHCSSLLVNAMLAVGCRFSTLTAARTDPNDSNTAGDHFFAETLRLLAEEDDRHSLTTIQALGLMSIREASCGRSSEAIFYSGQSIRLAIEMGLHHDSETGGGNGPSLEHAVRSATFWGAFALDQCWSLTIGRLPQFSCDTKVIPPPSIVEHVESSPWIPYTDDGDGLPNEKWQRQLTGSAGAPLERNCTQPSNVRSVYKTFCELSQIVHTSLYAFYTPGTHLNSRRLLQIYTEYLKWYDAIPEALRLGHNFTPAVLFAHMYYHYAILLLFRPFIKLNIITSGVSPKDVCTQAADAIQTLVSSYSQLYTLRRTPSFVPYFVLASTISHLVTHGSGATGPEHLHQGISDLSEMTSSHRFAMRARDILHFLAEHWEVEIVWTDGVGRDHKAACGPRSTSLNQFCPNIEDLDAKSSFRLGPRKEGEEAKEGGDMFWPFPLQGRPLLGSGVVLLEEAGFRVLENTDGSVAMS